MELDPVKALRPVKQVHQEKEVKHTAERIDLTQSPTKEPPVEDVKDTSEKDQEKTQEEKDFTKVWQRNMINIKHKVAPKVHQHTKLKAPLVGE